MAFGKFGYQALRAAINASNNGNNTIVAAITGQRIRVVSVYIISAGTVTVTWQDGAGGTTIGGPTALIAQTGYVLAPNEYGWFETSNSTLLNLNLSAGVQVGGAVVYFPA